MLSCPFDALDRIAGCLTVLTALLVARGVVGIGRLIADALREGEQ